MNLNTQYSTRLLGQVTTSTFQEVRGIDVYQPRFRGAFQTSTYSSTASCGNESSPPLFPNFATDLKAALPVCGGSRRSEALEFNQGFLRAVNEYRKRHGVEPLKLSPTLCKSSQQWAKHLAQQDFLQCHPNANSQAVFSSTSANPTAAPDSWYESGNNYAYGREPGNTNARPFTQMVWKDTREIGVGMAESKSQRFYVVAEFDPPCNSIGQYTRCVIPFQKETSTIIERKNGDAKGKNGSEMKTGVPDVSRTKAKVDPPIPAGSSYKGNTFEQECLKVHNQYRQKHDAPSLKLSNKLCKFAQDWANNVAAQDRMSHRPNNPYGENCYMSFGMEVTGATAVNAWYSEVKDYRFGGGAFAMNTGHFTQVVWKSSLEMGVGIAKSSRGCTYVVANYDPPGNYAGQFAANVLPC